MRRVIAGFIILFAMVGISLPAAAETISSSQKITVTAIVFPLRYVIVDGHNQIIEIGGNTSQKITPEVYKYSIAGPRIEMTPALSRSYIQIVNAVGMSPGQLHISPAPKDTKKLALNLGIL